MDVVVVVEYGIINSTLITVNGASADHFVEQSIVVFYDVDLVVLCCRQYGDQLAQSAKVLFVHSSIRQLSLHCIMNNMLVMKSAVLFVDNMEIS